MVSYGFSLAAPQVTELQSQLQDRDRRIAELEDRVRVMTEEIQVLPLLPVNTPTLVCALPPPATTLTSSVIKLCSL